MDAIKSLLDVFLHVGDHLQTIIQAWGPWTYVLLFAIILCETGLVVTPFLPGDSLLFAAGAMAALYPESLDIRLLLVLLSIAAVAGDTLNYAIGRWIGPRAFSLDTWFLKREHLAKTQAFYERHRHGERREDRERAERAVHGVAWPEGGGIVRREAGGEVSRAR